MTLRDECQGNQHAGEVAHFTSSAALRDPAKGKTCEVRGEKKDREGRSYRAVSPTISSVLDSYCLYFI